MAFRLASLVALQHACITGERIGGVTLFGGDGGWIRNDGLWMHIDGVSK